MKPAKSKSLRVRLIQRFIILVLIPLCVGNLVALHFYLRDNRRNMESLYLNNIRSVGSVVKTAMDSVLDVSLYASVEPNIYDFLAHSGTGDSILVERNALNTLAMLTTSSRYYNSISVMNSEGTLLGRGPKVVEIPPWEQREADKLGGYYFWNVQTADDGVRVISMCRKIRDVNDLGNELGYIKICFLMSSINGILTAPQSYPEIQYVIADGATPFFTSSSAYAVPPEVRLEATRLAERAGESVFRMDWEGESYLVAGYPMENTGWLLVSIAPYGYITSTSRTISLVLGATGFICLVLCLALSLRFSRSFMRPLNQLGALMTAIGNEDFSVRFTVPPEEEIRPMAQRFNEMSSRLQTLYEEIYQNKLQIVEARLQALEAQINPHFLYNALDTIYWMAKLGWVEQVQEMTTSLSRLFRLTLSRPDAGLLPLARELELLGCYMAIQQVRYGDSLTFRQEVQPGLLEEPVCKLVLQPLVENAIVHGIDVVGRGDIHVRVYAAGDLIVYEVEDSCGLADPAGIHRLLEEGGEPGTMRGFALCNIDRRIRLVSGRSRGVDVVCRDGATIFRVEQKRGASPPGLPTEEPGEVAGSV